MAVTLSEFVKRFEGLEDYLRSKAAEVLLKRETQIVDLSNKQLLQGINVQGKIMQKGYSTSYGKLRKRKGLQTSFVDLKFSGNYQKTKRLVADAQDNLDIISNADYEVYLRGNFPNHVGLTEKNAEIISNAIVDELAKLTKKYLTE